MRTYRAQIILYTNACRHLPQQCQLDGTFVDHFSCHCRFQYNVRRWKKEGIIAFCWCTVFELRKFRFFLSRNNKTYHSALNFGLHCNGIRRVQDFDYCHVIQLLTDTINDKVLTKYKSRRVALLLWSTRSLYLLFIYLSCELEAAELIQCIFFISSSRLSDPKSVLKMFFYAKSNFAMCGIWLSLQKQNIALPNLMIPITVIDWI